MFFVGKAEHTPDDRRCPECWANFPKKCQCGGLIHAQFLQEHWDSQLNIEYACDNCGDQYEEPPLKPLRRNHWKKNRR